MGGTVSPGWFKMTSLRHPKPRYGGRPPHQAKYYLNTVLFLYLIGFIPALAQQLPNDATSARLGLAAYHAGDPQAAWLYWSGPAQRGHVDSQFLIGHLYRTGKGIPRDLRQAVYWFRRAAEYGHGLAQLNLARMLDQGLGVRTDRAQAYFYAVRASEVLDGEAYAEARALAADIAKRMAPEEINQASQRIMTMPHMAMPNRRNDTTSREFSAIPR